MRHRFITAASAIVLGLATATHALDIDKDGAKALNDTLNKLLSEKMRDSGAITVNPAGARYEIIYDLGKVLTKSEDLWQALAKDGIRDVAITGLKPISVFATPQDNGQWNLEGDNSLDVSGHFTGAGEKPNDFTYSIASVAFNAVLDPAIGYFRSGDFSAEDIKFSSSTEDASVAASFADLKFKLALADSTSPDRLDFQGNGGFTAFAQDMTGRGVPPVQIAADSLDIDFKGTALPAKQIRDIILFSMDHAQESQINDETEAKFKAMLRDAFPLFSSLEETITLNNVSVTSTAGNGGAKTVGYHIALNGPSDAMRFGFAFNAIDITLDSPAMPAAQALFLPRRIDVQFGIPDLNFAAWSDEFLAIDLKKPAPPPEFGKEAATKLFPDGKLTVDFPNVSVKSDVYDVDISGKIEGKLNLRNNYRMQASILVRDFDQTISTVQELAKTDPQLNQATIGMMAAKGFAKTDPDGRQRWDVVRESDGSVTVNSVPIKGPDVSE